MTCPTSVVASAFLAGLGPPRQVPKPMVVFITQGTVSDDFEKFGVQELWQCARKPQKDVHGLQKTRLGTTDHVYMFEITICTQALDP
jgi:hypothetical protein